MQIVTIFFPIYEAYESYRHAKMLRSFTGEESKHLASSVSSGPFSQNTSRTSFGISTQSKEVYSMASLEKALAVNPMPLLHFAAGQDFTAENIIFLMRVKEWRQAWNRSPRQPGTREIDDAARSQLFRVAVDLYMTCVSDVTSEFPINVEGSVRTHLDSLFEHAVPEGKKRVSTESETGLFDFDSNIDDSPIQAEVKRIALAREESDDSTVTLWSNKSTASSIPEKPATVTTTKIVIEQRPTFPPHPAITPLGLARAQISPGFDHTVFDAAEASIKYLVLTNTWRKFVQRAQHDALALV